MRHTAASPLVVCVVLSFGRAQDTVECLSSLQRSTYPHCRTLLLDGDLTTHAVADIRTAFPDVGVVTLGENRGYAGNNNVGIRLALEQGADWVFLLNNDTVVDPDCIARLLDALSESATAGIAGPMLYHHAEPETIQSAGGTLSAYWRDAHLGQNQPDRHQFGTTRAVDWVSGCALMVGRRVIESVGVLDERYFMYGEELEWCLRARGAGATVLHVPLARVWHKGVRTDYRPSPAVTYYSTRNQLLTLWIHGAPWRVRAVRYLQLLRTLASWTVRPKWRRLKADHKDAMWSGALDYFRGRWGRMPARDSGGR